MAAMPVRLAEPSPSIISIAWGYRAYELAPGESAPNGSKQWVKHSSVATRVARKLAAFDAAITSLDGHPVELFGQAIFRARAILRHGSVLLMSCYYWYEELEHHDGAQASRNELGDVD
jgi:hypothetical protein